MADFVPLLLSCLPVAVFAGIVFVDIRFGVFLSGWFQEKPIYRDERPVLFWIFEGLMIAVMLALAIRPAVYLWTFLNGPR